MASKRFDVGTYEWKLFKDYWILCQQFWQVENKDEYWAQLSDALDNFCKKYNNNEFARQIAMAFQDTKEEEYRQSLRDGKRGE